MQKFIITLLALASSCVYAKTKNFEDIPERLMEEVMYASSFTGKNPPEINVADLQLGVGTGRNRIFMGGKTEHKGALTTNLLQDTKKSEACTISFDLHKVAGQPGQVIWGLYSPDRAFEHGLRLVIGPRRTLELVCTNFTESNVSGRSAKIKLGEIEDLLGKTLTIVYDGELDEVNAYINGQRHEDRIELSRATGSTAKRAYSCMSWCDNYCGHAHLEQVTLDNVMFWAIPLNQKQIKSLVKFEMTPTNWGILGGCLLVCVFVLKPLLRKKKPAPEA